MNSRMIGKSRMCNFRELIAVAVKIGDEPLELPFNASYNRKGDKVKYVHRYIKIQFI